jgi:beta-lactamase class A
LHGLAARILRVNIALSRRRDEGVGMATIDQGLTALGPKVSFLAASVTPQGTCHAVHEIVSSTLRPTASQFKLFVLGALANQIAAGRISWDENLTIEDATKSVGNEGVPGAFEALPQGTLESVQKTATNMISISDNTAADMLIGLVGRARFEAQFASGRRTQGQYR